MQQSHSCADFNMEIVTPSPEEFTRRLVISKVTILDDH